MYLLQTLLTTASFIIGTACYYRLKSKYQVMDRLNIYPVSFALAADPIINVDGERIDVFMGSLNGSIISTSLIDNMLYYNNFYPHFSNSIVKWMEWTDAGLIIASSKYAMILNQYNISQVFLTITPNQTINFATSIYSLNRNLTLIALSIGFTIQLYQNQTLIFTRQTNSLCNSMQFSKQGVFFYYIDNYTRHVINVEARQIVKNNTLLQMQHGAIATANYEISASVNLNGVLIIWNNYEALSNYSNSYLRSIVKFTQSSQKLITYIYETKTLHIRQKDKSSDSIWLLQQQLVTNSNTNQMICVKIVGQNIYILGTSSILVYQPNDFNISFLLIVVVAIIVFLTCVGFLVFLFKRQKKQLQISYMSQYYRLNSQAEVTLHQNKSYTNTNIVQNSYFHNESQPSSQTPQNYRINS